MPRPPRRIIPMSGCRGIPGLLITSVAVVVLTTACTPSWDLASAILKRSRSLASNVIQTGAVGAPSQLTATAQGSGFVLHWTAGTNGDGYDILGAEQASSDCSKATFTLLGSVNGLGTTQFTDAKRKVSQGNRFCYQVKTRRGNWTSRVNNPIVSAKRVDEEVVSSVVKVMAVSPTFSLTGMRITSTPLRRDTRLPTIAVSPAVRTRTPTAVQRPSSVASPTMPMRQMPSATPVATRKAVAAITPATVMPPTQALTATRTVR